MPSNALIFAVLVSGFIALRLCHFSRYLSQAWDTTRVILWSGAAGALIFVVARTGVLLLRLTSVGKYIKALLDGFLPAPFFGTILATMLTALLVAVIDARTAFFTSLVVRVPEVFAARATRWDKRIDEFTKYQVNSLNAFLREEWRLGRLVVFTLDDSKVYIAKVFAEPLQSPREAYVEIVPRWSGYRESVTRELRKSRDYGEVLDLIEGFRRDDPAKAAFAFRLLRVVLPFSRIVSVHGYDERIQVSSAISSAPNPTPAPTVPPE